MRPKSRVKQAKWRAKHPDRVRETARKAYRRLDPTVRREQARLKARHRRLAHPERERAKERRKRLKRLYGLTVPQYQAMVTAQNGRCAICGSQAALNVDHDHVTGKVRALLCGPCNLGLGSLESVLRRGVLASMTSYLSRFQ
jgi:hypothetical protein